MLLLFLFLLLKVSLSDHSRGLIELGATTKSDLKAFLYKFYDIKETDRNTDITIKIEDNSDSKKSAVKMGDIVQFYITKKATPLGEEPKAKVEDGTVWETMRCLTNNPAAQYDNIIGISNGGSTVREIEYKYVLIANLLATDTTNNTHKIHIRGYKCAEGLSDCAFSILATQDDKPWMWIILGILGGAVLMLCILGYYVCILRECTWWYEITKTPKLWLKMNIKDCGHNVIDRAMISFIEESNDNTRLRFLQWVTKLDVKFSFTGILEKDGKEVKIVKSVSEEFVPYAEEEIDDDWSEQDEQKKDEGSVAGENGGKDNEADQIATDVINEVGDIAPSIEPNSAESPDIIVGDGINVVGVDEKPVLVDGVGNENASGRENISLEEGGESVRETKEEEEEGEVVLEKKEEEKEGEESSDSSVTSSDDDVVGVGMDEVEMEVDPREEVENLGAEFDGEGGMEEEGEEEGEEEEEEGETSEYTSSEEEQPEVEKKDIVLFRTQYIADKRRYQIWICSTVPTSVSVKKQETWDEKTFISQLRKVLSNNKNVGSPIKRFWYKVKTGFRYYMARGTA